jgi:hypothetical protein
MIIVPPTESKTLAILSNPGMLLMCNASILKEEQHMQARDFQVKYIILYLITKYASYPSRGIALKDLFMVVLFVHIWFPNSECLLTSIYWYLLYSHFLCTWKWGCLLHWCNFGVLRASSNIWIYYIFFPTVRFGLCRHYLWNRPWKKDYSNNNLKILGFQLSFSVWCLSFLHQNVWCIGYIYVSLEMCATQLEMLWNRSW